MFLASSDKTLPVCPYGDMQVGCVQCPLHETVISRPKSRGQLIQKNNGAGDKNFLRGTLGQRGALQTCLTVSNRMKLLETSEKHRRQSLPTGISY